MLDHEQDNARLHKRIAELEAQLATFTKDEPKGTNGNHPSNGHSKPEPDIDPRLLGAALSGLSDGVVIASSEGRLLYFNAAALSLFGPMTPTPPADWSAHYGVYWEEGGDLVEANELPLVRALSGEHVDNVELFTRTAQRPEGTYLLCSARPIYDEHQKLQGAVVVCRDIGLRKQAEAEREQRLLAEEQRFAAEKQAMRMAKMLQALLDNLELVVWAIDDTGTITFHDGRGTDAVGVPRGSLIGKNMLELYGDPGGSLRRALAGVPQHEVRVTDGVAWESWYVPARDQDNEPWNVIGLSLNVTEAHQARTELEQKLALIERQQAVISELETPIIQVWDRILTLPMVGTVDSRRAARVTDDLLNQVAKTQALFAILDLTGVEVVDTATAGHMLNIISAVRLLGAEGIITGIRPNIAQTIIGLGVDLSRVRTLATLRDGLAFAIKKQAERMAAANAPFMQHVPNPGL